MGQEIQRKRREVLRPDMSILVTGKSGTVGSNLDGDGFRSSEYDLRIMEQSERLLEDRSPDAIVHCAAVVGGLDEHLRFKKKLFYDNMLINLNILEAARKKNINRVLSFLSSCPFFLFIWFITFFYNLSC